MKKRVVMIGATSSIAQECAKLWVMEGPLDLVLVGRNESKMAQMAQDLHIRSPESTLHIQVANFEEPEAIQHLVDDICAQGAIDMVLIAHGFLPNQKKCEQDLNACYEALMMNGISNVLFAEAFVSHMEKANHGTLAIISSVAGDRGRKSNYVYGAAKSLVSQYAQGLQHRLAGTNVKVVLIKPGPTDTPMTAHMKIQGMRLANVNQVAKSIVKKITQCKPVAYVPAKWALIMMIIRNMPRVVFNKMDI